MSSVLAARVGALEAFKEEASVHLKNLKERVNLSSSVKAKRTAFLKQKLLYEANKMLY